MTSQTNTIFTVKNRIPIIIANAGETLLLKFSTHRYIEIVTNKPVLVAQLAKSGLETDTNKDPAMMIIPPQSQWKWAYTFSTGRMALSGFTHYVLIAVPRVSIYKWVIVRR